ncbi:MAG TPA: GGDEF domain-containing protein, partial [Solirubrobacterales bacterium]|nr:GGDEF domain-containing protein [Solirubrobacterales bacterium]
MANERLLAEGGPAIDAVLGKLDPEDREVVLAALERAERTEAELRYLADHDSLTGLLDRRRFRAELDQYVS